ncbi:MAG: VOC family protein [Pyrinomonadaceae bacterium MAG19_C2-C3]|nr:VOC family protein [Pyrinomonadaceae bacterium MAG19_C2-C3]
MKLHHVGIAVESIARAAANYEQSFGIKLTSEIIDDERQRVRVAFAEAGAGVFIEFVEPLGADSPITRLLEKGGGLYHVCYLVTDIEVAVERVREAGGVVVSRPTPAAAFDNRRIAFVYTRDRNLVEFLEDVQQDGEESPDMRD